VRLSKKKKSRKIKLSKQIGDVFAFIGAPVYFALMYLFISVIYLKQSQEVIYKARNFRKKHKKKIVKIKFNFIHKLKLVLFKKKLKIAGFFIFIISIFGFTIWYFIFRGLPSPKELINRKVNTTTAIYDRNGVLLYQIYKDQNRTLVNLSQIPDYVKAATLASEDANFYSEPGFSVKGIIRAIIADVTNKEILAGGSTITQQLVKNTLLTNEKTIIRKIRELVLSVEVESQFSKDKILEMYMNEVSYGGSAYGIEAASEQYFGKTVDKLNLSEAALLAALPKSPTTYSPFGVHPELAIQRQKAVLELMARYGFITNAEKIDALNRKLEFAKNTINIKAPHFVMYARQRLVDEYGEEIVESGGLKVVTTLNYNIQKMAEETIETQLDKLKGLHVTNGAALVMDPTTGEILAMVGSKDYFDIGNDGNVNVTTSLRPPGSSIKIVNYAYALEHGYTPQTIILDAPISFNTPGSPIYTPINYDGKFAGNITLRNALAQSRNIPAVKILASYGVSHMIELGQAMGITTWNEENTYGLSLTLGGGATRLIDLARVYATIADYGDRPPVISIQKVTDYQGNNLPIDCDTKPCERSQVIDPRVAYQLIDILKDNTARAAEFGEHSSLVVTNHPEIAVKTGTSNDLRDNLTIGFNQKYLTAVWVGNNDNSPMSRIASGITGAAPIWNEIISRLTTNEQTMAWTIPAGLKMTACRIKTEYFLAETDAKNLCNIREGTPSAALSAH
jgi:penicillin-binding protein 1C